MSRHRRTPPHLRAPIVAPVCQYCKKISIGRQAKYGWIWECVDCDARVGCHKNGKIALGTLANGTLRQLRMDVHAAFDPLWKNTDKSRSDAYYWLATSLGIDPKECHIALFDEDRCKQVLLIISNKAD